MNRIAAAIAAFTAMAAAVLWRKEKNTEATAPDTGYTVQDLGGSMLQDAIETITPAQVPQVEPGRAERNEAAFLVMIRACEGTNKAGGYGALFGWPMAGRSFDPATATGHPQKFFDYTDKAGKKLKTSAAGAYQITYTTWAGYYAPFRIWCALNGRTAQGFTPATQDAFAVYLLDIDGAIEHVRAGRIDQAIAIARRRWASLPGAGYNQPERNRAYVLAAYQGAGGLTA